MDKSEFGKLLTKLRQRDNMTQSDLANALGVSVSAVSKWENGKNYPDIPVFSALRDLFHLSFDDLYHPVQTLRALEQGTLPSLETQISSPASPDRNALPKGRKLLILSALFLALLVSTGSLCALLWLSAQSEAVEEISMVSELDSDLFAVFRTGTSRDESIHQEVYEIVLVYQGGSTPLSKDIWYKEFRRRSREWWAEHPGTSLICLKITAYSSESAAGEQAGTEYLGYSYHYTRLK